MNELKLNQKIDSLLKEYSFVNDQMMRLLKESFFDLSFNMQHIKTEDRFFILLYFFSENLTSMEHLFKRSKQSWMEKEEVQNLLISYRKMILAHLMNLEENLKE